MNTPLELFAHVLTFFSLVACGEQVAWPTVVKKFLSYMSVFYFDLNLTAPECSIPNISFATKWLFSMGLPLGAAVLFLGIHVVRRCAGRGRGAGGVLVGSCASLQHKSKYMNKYIYVYKQRNSKKNAAAELSCWLVTLR